MSVALTVQEPSAKYLVQTDAHQQAPLVRHFDVIAQAPGGVARLLELILTLAVQGKLLPQDPRDEPASKLLKKIRAEKDRLIAEGKIKRDKPLPPIEDDEQPFGLPRGWVWVRLQQAYDVRDGTHDTPKYQTTGYPLVTSKNIYGGVLDLSDVKLISVADHEQISGRSKVDRNDILFAMIGSIGNPVLVNTDIEFSVKNVALFKYYAASFSCPHYLLLVLQAEVPGIKDRAAGGVQAFISLGQLRTSVVALPPLAEQSRIVTRVEELMRLCDALEAKGRLEAAQHTQLVSTLLDTLTNSETPEQLTENWQRIATHFDLLLDRPQAVDALEQTILQLAVRGLLVPQDPQDEPASALLKKIRLEKDRLITEGKIKRDKPLSPIAEDEQPFALPKGWEWERLGEIVMISGGVTLGRKTSIPAPVSLPYLRVANVQRWHLNLTSMKEVVIDRTELGRFQLANGDLLITEGGDWDKVGRTTIWRDELPTCLHQNHVFKARGTSPEWNPVWAEMFLNSTIARAYFASSAKQTTNLASINMTQLKDCVFPLPPLSEQSRIVTRVNELRALCADLRTRLIASQSTQAHLAEALIGEAIAA